MKSLVAVIGAAFLLIGSHAKAQNWTYSIEPYLLAASIEGESGLGRVTGAEIDVDFSRILETLDMALMIHFEAHSANGWGIMLDYGFMELSDNIFGERGGVVDARVRQGILEGMLVKQSRNPSSGLEYFAGFRWWDNEVDVAIDPAILPGDITRKVDASWVDLVVGARWTRPLNERWDFRIKGDIGGFGVKSDFTSSIALGAVYSFSNRYALDLQYKALWVEYEDGNTRQPGFFAYDTVTHGPIVGFQFNF